MRYVSQYKRARELSHLFSRRWVVIGAWFRYFASDTRSFSFFIYYYSCEISTINMSVASTQILSPASLHRDRVFGDESNRFHSLPARAQEENDLNRSSRRNQSAYPNAKPLSSIPGPLKSTTERAKAAAIVLNRYRIEYKNDWDFPESILRSEAQIQNALDRNVAIELVIPAFPFKSSNRSKKVLGPLPDEAERLSLLHLDGLCLAIKDVTDSDTFLTIVSDGITYNGNYLTKVSYLATADLP